MSTKCLASFEQGFVPDSLSIINGTKEAGTGRPYYQTVTEPDNIKWCLATSKTVAAQPEVDISVYEGAGGGTVSGSFALFPQDLDYSATPDPIVAFGDVEMFLYRDFPSMKGFSDDAAPIADFMSEFKSINWIPSGESAVLTINAACGFTGEDGVFTNTLQASVDSDVNLSAGDYYVARLPSTAAASTNPPRFLTEVSATPTTFTGTSEGTIETPEGTAELFKITVTNNAVLKSTEATSIDMGDGSTDKWIPYSEDPRTAPNYKISIEDNSSEVASDNSLVVNTGWWTIASFNIDLAASGELYLKLQDGQNEKNISTTKVSLFADQTTVKLRGALGTGSKIDDIRVDDSINAGNPPGPTRGRPILPYVTGNSNFTASPDNVQLEIPNSIVKGWTYCPTVEAFYAFDTSGELWRYEADDYTSTSISAAVTSFKFALLIYDEYRDRLYGVADGILKEITPHVTAGSETVTDIDLNAVHGITFHGSQTGGVSSNTVMAGVYVPSTRKTFFLSYENDLLIEFGDPSQAAELTSWNSTALGGTFVDPGSTLQATSTFLQHRMVYNQSLDCLFAIDDSVIAKIDINALRTGGPTPTTFSAVISARQIMCSPGGSFTNKDEFMVRGTSSSFYRYNMVTEATIGVAGTGTGNHQHFPGWNVIAGSNTTAANSDVLVPKLSVESDRVQTGDTLTSGESNYMVSPYNGDVIVSPNDTVTLKRIQEINNDDPESNTLMFRDDKVMAEGTTGEKISFTSPTPESPGYLKYVGKNILLGDVRGLGGVNIHADATVAVSGLSYSKGDRVISDYGWQEETPAKIAWYFDGPYQQDTNIPPNHGVNTATIGRVGTTSTFVDGAGVLTAGFNDNAMTVLHQTSTTKGYYTWDSHGLSNTTGEFSINMIVWATGSVGTGEGASIFTADYASPDGANTVGIYADSTTSMGVKAFGVNYAQGDLIQGSYHTVTVGRNSSNEIVWTYDGVDTVLTTSTAEVQWGQLSMFADSVDVNATDNVVVLAFAVHDDAYVRWPFSTEGTIRGMGGPSVTVEKR